MPTTITSRGVGGVVIGLAAITAVSCQSTSASSTMIKVPAVEASTEVAVARMPRPDGPQTESIVLVAVDGVRWQDVYVGVDRELAEAEAIPEAFMLPPERLLPNLHQRVIANGVALGAPGHGAAMRASGPNHVSLPGYLEMLGGAAPEDCTSNDCPATRRPTIADAFRDAYGPEGGAVGVITSWETIERAAATDTRGIALSNGRTGGATRDTLRSDAVIADLLDVGAEVGPYPGGGDYRPDYYTAAIALRYLWARRPRFLFIGLGDTDEWGHQDNYEAYLQALRFADAFVGNILDTLEMMGTYGSRTTVIVTTDHGRSNDFTGHGRSHESGQVWLMATGGGVPALGFVDSPRERRLADIDPTIRSLVGLTPRSDGGSVLAEVFGSSAMYAAR